MIGSGRTEHRGKVLDLGATAFLDLQRDRLEDVGDVDVVLDVIGGEILDRSAKVVRPGGVLVTLAEPPRVRPEQARTIFFVVEPDRARLDALQRRVRDGRLRLAVDAVCPLAEAVSAFTPNRRKRGKIIIQVTDAA